MNKLLLVIPENSYKSNDFVLTAEKLGIDFLIITDSEQVTSQFGDTVIVQNFDENISDETLIKLQKITHVLPVDHSGLKYAGYLVDLLGAKGNKLFAIEHSMNKFESRNTFNSISNIKAKNMIAKSLKDIELFTEKHGTSVLKPNFGSASKSVLKINNFNQSKDYIINLMNDCEGQEMIIEQYIEGTEYALEGNLINSNLNKITIFDKPIEYKEPYFEESIYITPSELSEELQNQIVELIGNACKKIGLENGPIHVEFKILDENIFIIEINPRMIGGLCSKCLSFGLFKVSLEEITLHAFLYDELKPIELLSNYVGVLMLPTPKTGKFVSINQDELEKIDNVSTVEITVSQNSDLLEPPFGDKYLGFVFSQANEKVLVINALMKAMSTSMPIIK
ncbi:MAG: acetyl-CoA carboxylase biotin carboxylase subunit family protein [Candidatus Actinomarina sp.]